MNKLLKENFYCLFYSRINILVLITFSMAAEIAAVLKAIYRDGYNKYSDVLSNSAIWLMIPIVILTSMMIYVFTSDYFDSRFYEVEHISGYNASKFIIAKIISITIAVSTVFAVETVFLFAIFDLLAGKKIYTNTIIRILAILLIIIRLCFDSVFIRYIAQNFFVYMGGICAFWILLPDKLKTDIQGISVFSFTYKYQMSIVASFNASGSMILNKVIIYGVISCTVRFLVYILFAKMTTKY